MINGVFAGGGVKGIALAGAAAATMEAGYEFGHLVRTSSGALVASLVAAGFDEDDLRLAMMHVPWSELFRPLFFTRIPLIGKGLGIALARAQCDGRLMEKTWRRMLASKGVRTFGDIEPGLLRIVTTDLTHQTGVVLPDDLPMYGYDPREFSVSRAVAMSSAVPFFVRPVRLIDRRTRQALLFVDGALASNFPLIVGHRSRIWPIVGYRFRDDSGRPALTFSGPASLARGVVGASISAADGLGPPAKDDHLVIRIPLANDPLDFDVNAQDAIDMFEVGRAEALRELGGAQLKAKAMAEGN